MEIFDSPKFAEFKRMEERRRVQQQKAIQDANTRRAMYENLKKGDQPRLSAPYPKTQGGGVPAYTEPLEHSIKPLPTLPPIVGNTTYDPTRFETPYETRGTGFLRNKMAIGREVLPTLSQGTGEPSNSNPTVL